jgi:hypothetical protein
MNGKFRILITNENRLTCYSDWNYERQKDGSCDLVKGFPPPDHSLLCKQDENAIEYFKPTGYRRIGGTSCQGGTEFDKSTTAYPCPGKDDEFNKKHGPSNWGIFFAVTIPIIVASSVGYWVWKNWASKFGQIRLGEQCKSPCSFHIFS